MSDELIDPGERVKVTVAVDVIGRPASGKTTVIRHIAAQLKELGFEVEIDWGIDGEPMTSTDPRMSLEARTELLTKESKILITQRQAPRLWNCKGNV